MANGMGFNWQSRITGGAARPGAIDGLQPQFRSNIERMLTDMPANLSAGVQLTSAFRSPQRQAEILRESLAKRVGPDGVARWDAEVANAGGDVVAAGQNARPWLREAGITKWVAPPGSSNHQRGDAADFAKMSPEQQAWIHSNAANYDLNFPLSNEDWHIEPAGLRSGQSQPTAVAQATPSVAPTISNMQNKTFDPVGEVVSAAQGNALNPPPSPQEPPASATASASAPAAPQKGLLGLDVPKGLPQMLNFAALAMNSQQQPDDTPQGGMLRASQPVQIQPLLTNNNAERFKPWSMLFNGRVA